MINVLEFFKNIPKKKCHTCGFDIYEKADCYTNQCDECDDPAH